LFPWQMVRRQCDIFEHVLFSGELPKCVMPPLYGLSDFCFHLDFMSPYIDFVR
jgi:hypothetical protein